MTERRASRSHPERGPRKPCSACGRLIGVYANGTVRPHYPANGREVLCWGAFALPAPTSGGAVTYRQTPRTSPSARR